jgi:hypothetical protein
MPARKSSKPASNVDFEKKSKSIKGRGGKRPGAGRKKKTATPADKIKKPEKTTRKQGFQPGQSGNPAGRPKGARHKTTLLAEKLMQAEAEGIVNVVIAAAKSGDIPAARIILERIAPPRKDNAINFDWPVIESASDATKAMASVLSAVAIGEVTPGEAGEVAKLIEAFMKIHEMYELEKRIAALEAQRPQ